LQDNQSNVDGPETEESVWLEWVVGFVKDAKGVLRYNTATKSKQRQVAAPIQAGTQKRLRSVAKNDTKVAQK
jgi:hypothetical protein